MNENEDTTTAAQPTQPSVEPATPEQSPVVAPTPAQSSPPQPEPVATQPSVTPGYPAPKSNKKMLIIIGAIVGAVVLLGIIAWVVYAALFAVTKEDYRQAAAISNDVSTVGSQSYSDVLKISYITTYTTETAIKNDVDSAKDSLTEYKSANTKFKDLKALRDKDVKKAYDAYMEKYNGFVRFSNSYIDSAEKVLPAVVGCEKISSTSISNLSSFNIAIAPCKEALNDAKDVSDPDLKKFVAAYLENAKDITAIVTEATTLSSSDYVRRSALSTQIYDATDKLQDAQKDANSNIEKRLKEVNPRASYNNFGDLLTDKQRK